MLQFLSFFSYKYIFCPFQNVTQREQTYRWNAFQGVLGQVSLHLVQGCGIYCQTNIIQFNMVLVVHMKIAIQFSNCVQTALEIIVISKLSLLLQCHCLEHIQFFSQIYYFCSDLLLIYGAFSKITLSGNVFLLHNSYFFNFLNVSDFLDKIIHLNLHLLYIFYLEFHSLLIKYWLWYTFL